MSNFDKCFDRLIDHEGGYTLGNNDPGGETKWGISKRSYPKLNICLLTRDDAKRIYFVDFWQRGQMDQFDFAIAFQLFDTAVNSGIETALRLLQRAVNVADDGHIGPVTLAAIKTMSTSDVLMCFNAERLDFMRKLSAWKFFGSGWAGRIAKNLRYSAQDD